jgi:hypothetical protein
VHASVRGSSAYLRGTLEDVMSSGHPRVPDYGELISPLEAFSWQEDASVAEQRCRRKRRGRVLAALVGLTFAVLLLGAQSSIFQSMALGKW